MNVFKRILRISYFILIAVMISVGVALTGVGPILPRNRERLIGKAKTEQVDKTKVERKNGAVELFG